MRIAPPAVNHCSVAASFFISERHAFTLLHPNSVGYGYKWYKQRVLNSIHCDVAQPFCIVDMKA